MADTQSLLSKIAALRQRLEEATGLTTTAGSAVVSLLTEERQALDDVQQLEMQVAAGSQETALLDTTVRQIADAVTPPPPAVFWPAQLTARARRCVERGRELLAQLRAMSEQPLLCRDPEDLLDRRFRETAAMADATLRTVQAFPSAPGSQLRLCDGIEAILEVVGRRIVLMSAILARRRREEDWVATLASLLTRLDAGEATDADAVMALAEDIMGEAQDGAPMRFLTPGSDEAARVVACHGLMVAQVAARLVRHDDDLRHQTQDPVLAALLHDAGMLQVPAAILGHAGPLDDGQRRAVEAHPRAGAEMLVRLLPRAGWLADAALGHHERLDGTGYPGGLREGQIPPLTRLLAVCDVYAAQCMPRPHRPARETRTALTDTLLMAERGLLDRFHAERLLALSFYPVGTAVELADGAVGVVIAAPTGRRDICLSAPARPVLALYTGPDGQPLPEPQYLDLGQVDGHSIVRSLSAAERRQALGKCYPGAA